MKNRVDLFYVNNVALDVIHTIQEARNKLYSDKYLFPKVEMSLNDSGNVNISITTEKYPCQNILEAVCNRCNLALNIIPWCEIDGYHFCSSNCARYYLEIKIYNICNSYSLESGFKL